MHKVQVLDGGQHEDLVGRHPDGGDDAAAEEGWIRVGGPGPDAACKKNDECNQIDGTLAVDLGEGIDQEDAETQGQNQPRGGLRECVDRDVHFLRNVHKPRREHWAKGADHCGGEADDKQDQILLPLGPLR